MSVNPQFANAALNIGCPIASTSTPSLDATYPLDLQTRQRWGEAWSYLAHNGVLPANWQHMPVQDINGQTHSMTPQQFNAFFAAVVDYAAQLDGIISGSMPMTALPTPPGPIP